MTTARNITTTDITTAWGGPSFSSALVRRSAPSTGSFSFMQADFDSLGNLIRTYDSGSGRMDCYGVNSTGAAFVVAYSGAGADGNTLGHFAYRGKDDAGNYSTYCYILGTAVNVASAGAGLNSKLFLGVMKAQTAGAGNAQPNAGVTLNGTDSTFTFGAAWSIGTTTGSLTVGSGGVTGITLSSTGVTTNLPVKLSQELYSNKTSNYTVTTSDYGTVFTNIGAAGEVDFTLPATPGGSGVKVAFGILASQVVKIIANTGQTINVGGSGSASAGNISSSQNGAFVELSWSASASRWTATRVTGSGGSSGAGGWTVT